MAIQYPNPILPHKVFNRTFLQEVSANVKFAEITPRANLDTLQFFLKKYFGISEAIPDNFGGINISSDSELEKYILSINSASVILDTNVYQSYQESLVPRLQILVEYLKAIGVDQITELTIVKKNLFGYTSPNAYSAWRFALHESFKEKVLKDLASNSTGSEKPFKTTIEIIDKFDGGEVRYPFSIEVKDENNFNFQMDLTGIVNDLAVTSIIENANILNDIIFTTFINMMSDNTINLLQQ